MTAQELLSLWRERWGKASQDALMRPFIRGKLAQKLQKLALADFWRTPGFLWLCGGVFIWLATMPLNMVAQIFVSGLLILFAVVLHVHRGLMPALVISGISLFLSVRYFVWRYTETLPHWLGWDFAVGFILCSAEFMLWLQVALAWWQQIWPLRRPMESMQQEALYWPVLDVVLCVKDESLDIVERTLNDLQVQDWPENKLRLHVLTLHERPALRELVKARGLDWLAAPADSDGLLSALQQSWQQMQGELVLVLERPLAFNDTKSFQKICAPMVNHPRLGLLGTPIGSCLPRPHAKHESLVAAHAAPAPIVLLRRNAVDSVGGLPSDPPVPAAHLGLSLVRSGHQCAYLCMDDWSRIDQPFPRRMLTMRKCLIVVSEALRFYRPLPISVLALLPFVVLSFQLQPLLASWGELVVYAVPHFFLGVLIWAGREERGGLSLVSALHERLLGWVLLVRTGRSYGFTMLRRLFCVRGEAIASPLARSPIQFGWPGWLFFVGFCALAYVAWGDLQRQHTQHFSSLYYGWSIYCLLQCLAMLAVRQEFAQITSEQPMRARLRAMLRLSSGHQLQGESLDFPAVPLAVRVRSGGRFNPGDDVHLSLFRGAFEFATPVRVQSIRRSNEDCVVELTLPKADLADYQAMGRAVYSRDPDWPPWLPGEQSDRIMPLWMHRLGRWATDVFYNLVVGSLIYKQWERLLSWLLSRIKKNG